MARNGSGTYSNPYPNFASGTVISSTEVNANNNQIATALTQSIAVDGQSVVTGDIPLATHKFTGMKVGSASTDSLSLGQAQAEAFVWCGTAGGGADAITLSPSPAITAYAAGQRFVWMASGSTNTGATTVAISGLTAIALQDNGAALTAGQHAAGKMFMGILNTTSTMQIMQVQVSGTDPLIVSSLTVDGNSQFNGTIITGVDDTGYDVKFFGATAGSYMLWDESADNLKLAGSAGLTVDGVTTHGGDVVSDTDSTDSLGTTSVRWAGVWTDKINGAVAPEHFEGKNRIINGNMVIDQRNSGSAVTINSTGNVYVLDRWTASGQSSDGVFTVQQSATAPAGFVNSQLVTVTTADTSIATTQQYMLTQFIEGYNIADLNWGTADAQAITISFWVRSSLTGTFGGALNNNANDRSYPFTYTISSADTYERKTITVAGDTTGTWLTTNGRGLAVRFTLGAGSAVAGSAGSWAGATYYGPTGAVNLIATNGATFYVTGVQVEAGSVATAVEMRQYGTELSLCQRYLPAFIYSGQGVLGLAQCYGTTQADLILFFPVSARVAPTGLSVSAATHISMGTAVGGSVASTSIAFAKASVSGMFVRVNTGGSLASGNAATAFFNDTAGKLLMTGCEL